MAKARNGWYARTEIEKVTLDYVKANCKLTPREIELLKLIYERKLVRRDMLEIISPSYRNLGANRTRIMNRSIRKMFLNMCIDKIHEKQEIGKGNTPCFIALDKGGSLLLGVKHKRRIIHYKTQLNGQTIIQRKLPANYRHINGINGLEVETILFCQRTGNELLNWKHEVEFSFQFSNDRITVIPDVHMTIAVNDKQFDAFIEYDTGSENLRNKDRFPTIDQKLVKYKMLKNSNVWQNNNLQYFPILLFVTEDGKSNRIKYFNKKCRDLGVPGFGIYYQNYTNFLRQLATLS